MNKKIFFIALFVSFALLMRAALTAQASPSSQQLQYATPTPGPDGRIIYIVVEGDNCLRISLLTGVSVAELQRLNQLDEACNLNVGQQLFIGMGGPSAVSPTPGPSPTATPILPTPTPSSGGTAKVCVLLYDDLNGDGERETGELGIAGGSVSLAGTSGGYSQTLTTISEIDPDTEEPASVCFVDVPAGNYTISMGIPEGYNPTTALSVVLADAVAVQAGGSYNIPFGAQLSTVPVNDPAEGGKSSSIALIGGILLLLGGGLAYMAYRSSSGSRKMRFK